MNQLATLLVFVPILADTGLTLIRRTWAGHHPFVPHCDFYYQRMILAGTPQWQVLLLHWTAMVCWGCLGLVLT